MDIKTPTLIIDKEKCLGNIERMAAKAKKSGVSLRPHFKTHFSAEIASWFRDFGITTCTVSSVAMARYFSDHGWKDITIAFPYNPREAGDISLLTEDNSLSILIESEESMQHARENIRGKAGYFIKIDVGTHRTGIDPRNTSLIASLVSSSTEQMKFQGFLAHAGHTYGSVGYQSVKWIFDQSVKDLTRLKSEFGGLLSYGDTPSCSMVEDLSAFDEIRPGNFVFYDWMQHRIGSCSVQDIAVCLACPVVAIHPERKEIVVYGGAVHLSKDLIQEPDLYNKTRNCYGKMVAFRNGTWDAQVIGHVDRLSQEHGIIKVAEEQLSLLNVGDVIGILPVHSCLCADLQGFYLSSTGEHIQKMTKS